MITELHILNCQIVTSLHIQLTAGRGGVGLTSGRLGFGGVGGGVVRLAAALPVGGVPGKKSKKASINAWLDVAKR